MDEAFKIRFQIVLDRLFLDIYIGRCMFEIEIIYSVSL